MILLVVSVHAAPAMTLEDRRLSSTPKWVNPCGLAAEDFTGDLEVVQLTDSQLLHQVVVQAKTALMHAILFRDDYVSTRVSFPSPHNFPLSKKKRSCARDSNHYRSRKAMIRLLYGEKWRAVWLEHVVSYRFLDYILVRVRGDRRPR